MKLKTILTVGALSLGLSGMVNAQTRMYITGSTAYRPAVFFAISNIMESGTYSCATYKASGVATADPSLASFIYATGTVSGVGGVIIKADWSGSEAGIGDLTAAANGSPESFPADSLTLPAAGSAASVTTASPSSTESHNVDVAMADNDQAHSKTTSPSLTGTHVGTVPFVWVKNGQVSGGAGLADWGRLQNVTDPQLRVALAGGTPLALITGNVLDTNWVYVAGRDANSGTRANTLLDTQFGEFSASIQQIEISGTSPNAAITGGNYVTGTAGQSSGGTLSSSMTLTGSGTEADPIQALNSVNNGGWYAIAYLGMYDADAALGIGTASTVVPPNQPASVLTYNGVSESPTGVETGMYSFWGNEFLYKSKNNFASSTTLLTKLTTAVEAATDGTHEIPLSAMQASKTTSAADATSDIQ